MFRITPIPTTRVSDLLAQQRQTNQLQSDQVDVLRIQQQISTGRRIQLLSEDAPAGMRAVALQRLLEQKDQIQKNLASTDSFLSATDTALQDVSNLLAQAKAEALGVTGAVGSDLDRAAVAQQIDAAIQDLLGIGNQNVNGRYLFAGSRTDQLPFEQKGSYIRYNGNETRLSNYGDIDLLLDSNVSGSEVFGAISDPVVSTVDLNPILTADTRLADLHNGAGVARGSIRISDGTSESVIDLSSAHTVGDVAALIEANPPAGRTLTVEITPTGLTVSLDSAGGGDLRILEENGGSTANDLGILSESSFGIGPIVGGDLDPRVQLTTPLADAFGARAYALIDPAGANNTLTIEAKTRGAALNGYTFTFVDNVPASGVSVTATGPSSFEIEIDSGSSTANQVLTALNADAGFGANFTASLDTTIEATNTGNGAITIPVAAGTTAHGSGAELDQTSGLQILNGDQVHVIDLSTAVTVEDLLNTLNGSPADVLATLNSDGRTISVRSRLSGADFAIGENGGTTAADLGLRTYTGTTRLEDLNHGLGVHTNEIGDDFIIRRKDGVELSFDVSAASTIGDVINQINNHAANLDPATRVVARLATNGNGIELVDDGLVGTGQLTVLKVNNSQAAQDLGLIPVGQSSTSTSAAASFATASLQQAGANNDILFTATQSGPQRNGVQFVFNAVALGSDSAVVAPFNPATNTLTIDYDPAFTTANTIIAQVDAEGTFDATLDTTADPANDGTGLVGAAPATPLTTAGGTSQLLTGRDTNPQETDSIFNSLIRLRNALLANDAVEISRATQLVDGRVEDINYVRAGVGARQQGLEAVQTRLQDETVNLKDALSGEIDVSLDEAISNLVARQAAYQAALQTTAQISRLTLLDFL